MSHLLSKLSAISRASFIRRTIRRETGSVASRVARIVIIAVLSVFAALSLSGCLGFDINISTPFDKLEQRIDEIERDGDGRVWENEDGDMDDDDRTHEHENDDDEDGESILDYEYYHDDIDGGLVNEFVNHL